MRFLGAGVVDFSCCGWIDVVWQLLEGPAEEDGG